MGTHHCAIFPTNAHGATQKNYRECELNPGHKNFMTVDELNKKTPSEIGLSERDMASLRNFIGRTVRVVVGYTSVDRPDTFEMDTKIPYPCSEMKGSIYTRYGTGFLHDCTFWDEECICIDCKMSPSPMPDRESHYFIIKTATHVIYDEQEAQNARFEFFYDSEDTKRVKTAYGVTVLDPYDNLLDADRCFVLCVTHDVDLANKLFELLSEKTRKSYFRSDLDRVLISHPHGVSKRISVGEYIRRDISIRSKKTSVKLKKDTKIKFLGCDDAGSVAESINRILGKTVIDLDDRSNDFVLCCDLSVCHPDGIQVTVDYRYFLDYEPGTQYFDAWCNIFQPETQLRTEDGSLYTFRLKDTGVPAVHMEIHEEIGYFFDYCDIDIFSQQTCLVYDMASCPGSSGAHVKPYVDYHISYVYREGDVHFGNHGYSNRSNWMFFGYKHPVSPFSLPGQTTELDFDSLCDTYCESTEDSEDSQEFEEFEESEQIGGFEDSKGFEKSEEPEKSGEFGESEHIEGFEDSKGFEKSEESEEFEESEHIEGFEDSKGCEKSEESEMSEEFGESEQIEGFEDSKGFEKSEESEEFGESEHIEGFEDSKGCEKSEESEKSEEFGESEQIEGFEDSKGFEKSKESTEFKDPKEFEESAKSLKKLKGLKSLKRVKSLKRLKSMKSF